MGTSLLGAILARRWVLTRLVPAVAVVILLLYLVPVLVDWKAATDAKGAEPVGSATFSELVQPPFPRGVLVLTGQFVEVDHASRRAANLVPFEFVDPIPTDVAAGDRVQVTCRVRVMKEGVLAPYALRVDVCRDVVHLGPSSG